MISDCVASATLSASCHNHLDHDQREGTMLNVYQKKYIWRHFGSWFVTGHTTFYLEGGQRTILELKY